MTKMFNGLLNFTHFHSINKNPHLIIMTALQYKQGNIPWTEDHMFHAWEWSFHLQMDPCRCCRFQFRHPSKTKFTGWKSRAQYRFRCAALHNMSTRWQNDYRCAAFHSILRRLETLKTPCLWTSGKHEDLRSKSEYLNQKTICTTILLYA